MYNELFISFVLQLRSQSKIYDTFTLLNYTIYTLFSIRKNSISFSIYIAAIQTSSSKHIVRNCNDVEGESQNKIREV